MPETRSTVVDDCRLIARQIASLAEDAPSWLPVLSNAAALVYEGLPDVSWAGFYIADGAGTLVLGPFQGKLACTRIPWGKGVCGTAAAHDRVQVVEDVHRFPGHIACDAASASEIVLPIHGRDGAVCAVLDLDSVSPARFGEAEAEGLALVAGAIERSVSWAGAEASAGRP